MFCSQCGAKIDDTEKFCPVCGGNVERNTNPPPKDSPSQTTSLPDGNKSSEQMPTKRAMPFWYKLIAFIAVVALIGVTWGILFTESLVDVVDNQLEALRKDDISKAYFAYTSKDFQSATSVDQFRNFVHAYPVFLNNKSAHFTQRAMENNIGTLKGNLTSTDNVTTPIEYKLIKENDKWKILSVRLLKPGTIQNAKEADHVEDLIVLVKVQLKDIQDKKFPEAYQNFSSKEFKEATSEKAFEEFIKRYPILFHHHVISFHKPTIRNGIGTLSVILQSEELAAYLKYYLIYEDQKWKIWSMRVLSPSEEEEKKGKGKKSAAVAAKVAVNPMSFGSIILGEHVDEHGQIKLAATKFKSTLNDLYVNIEVKNGLKGSMVFLSLQHLDSGSSIPAKAEIEENGDSMLMSIFTPPSTGWPKGDYKLIVTTSSGLNQVVDFTID